METTPNDLRQQQFEIKFRGYNPDDVEVFRELAGNALEEARGEVLQLTEENKHLKERLKHLIELEDTLKAAVLEAQKNSESTIAVAKKEAEVTVASAEKEKDLILREAQNVRDEVISDMHGRMGKLVNDINKIRFIRDNYFSQLKNLISSHMDMIDRAMAEESEKGQKPGHIPKRPEYKKPESTPHREPNDEPHEAPDMNTASHESDDPPAGEPEEAPHDDHPNESKQDTEKPSTRENSSDSEWEHLKEQLSEE